MAEENVAVEEKVPGTAIPGEALPGSGDKNEQPPSITIEEFARTKGHIPLENWTGDPEDWIDAKTFVDNEWKIAAKFKNEVKKLTESTEFIKTHMEDMIDRGVKTKVAELEQERLEAIKDGNVDEVLKIEKEIEETNKPASHNDGIDPKAQAWMDKEENNWYGKDDDLTIYADGVLSKEIDAGKTVEQALKVVDARVANFRKTLIEGEKKPEKKQVITPSATTVGTGTPPDKGTKNTWTYSDLDETEQQFCDRFVRSGAGTQADYINQLVKSKGGKLR